MRPVVVRVITTNYDYPFLPSSDLTYILLCLVMGDISDIGHIDDMTLMT